MGFTKLDEGIIQSSIMAEDAETFKIWIAMLAMCKENGIAYVSPVFISAICRIPIEDVMGSIKKLSEPDPVSRSMDNEGRRIRRVNGGFEVLNYLTYRTISLKSAEAERKRLYREGLKNESVNVQDCPDNETKCPDSSVSVSSSLSSSSCKEENKEKKATFEDFWERYPKKVEKEDARTNWDRLVKSGVEPDLIIQATEGYAKVESISGTEPKFIKNPPTFLAKDRWRDYLPGGEGLNNATPSKEHEIRKERSVGMNNKPSTAKEDSSHRLLNEIQEKILDEREPEIMEVKEKGDKKRFEQIMLEIKEETSRRFSEMENEEPL